MATYRSTSVLLSSDGIRTPGTAALFTEPARKGGTPPWAGDFRLANSAGNGPKNAVGKTFTLELPDGSTGKVVVQSLKSGRRRRAGVDGRGRTPLLIRQLIAADATGWRRPVCDPAEVNAFG
jgi:hypothetical protein